MKRIDNIHSNIGLEFKKLPITVHLVGKKVVGLMINVNKTNGHLLVQLKCLELLLVE